MVGADSTQALVAVGQIGAIASRSTSQQERAQDILDALHQVVPHVAAEIVMLDPFDGDSHVLASTGYSDQVLADLHSTEFHELMRYLDLPDTGRPVRMKDLPGDPLDNWAVSDVLIPAGYREGMTMCLRTSDGRFTGVLNLSTDSAEHPSDLARDVIASLCTSLGNLTDPTQGTRWIQMLLGAGSRVIGLDAAGSTVAIPGATGHRLLATDSDLIRVARKSSVRGSWSSFVWPDEDEWLRVRVVPCRPEEPITTVVSVDSVDLGPLTRRELEVLTLAAEGLSNQEIGDALIISSRTVANHVEHILDKLEAPNRAAAAAYALREGIIMGRVDCPGRPD